MRSKAIGESTCHRWREAVGADLLDGVQVDGVRPHRGVQGEAEGAELVPHSLAVAPAELALVAEGSAYVTINAARVLAGTGEAERSIPGIVIAALSLTVMPFLPAARRKAGRELGSASAVAAQADPAVHVPLRRPPVRSAPQRFPRLVLSRPDRALVIVAIPVKVGRDAWQAKGAAPCLPHSRVHPLPRAVAREQRRQVVALPREAG